MESMIHSRGIVLIFVILYRFTLIDTLERKFGIHALMRYYISREQDPLYISM